MVYLLCLTTFAPILISFTSRQALNEALVPIRKPVYKLRLHRRAQSRGDHNLHGWTRLTRTPVFLRTEFARGELADLEMTFVQVVDDFLAPMPVYMLEASDPVLIQLGGIARGMSGSPIFSEQGTWGAIAYGFPSQDSGDEPLFGLFGPTGDFGGDETLDDVFARVNEPDENVLMKARLTFQMPSEEGGFPPPPDSGDGSQIGLGGLANFVDLFSDPGGSAATVSTQEEVDLFLEGIQTLRIQVVED